MPAKQPGVAKPTESPGVSKRMQLPGNLDQTIFRLGAVAFSSLSALALIAAYIGPGSQLEYAAVWTITGLAFVGAVVSWYMAQHRAPIQLVLVLALLGVVLITLEAIVTGGTRTHLLVLYVVPASSPPRC